MLCSTEGPYKVDFSHPINPIDDASHHGAAGGPLKFYNSQVVLTTHISSYLIVFKRVIRIRIVKLKFRQPV